MWTILQYIRVHSCFLNCWYFYLSKQTLFSYWIKLSTWSLNMDNVLLVSWQKCSFNTVISYFSPETTDHMYMLLQWHLVWQTLNCQSVVYRNSITNISIKCLSSFPCLKKYVYKVRLKKKIIWISACNYMASYSLNLTKHVYSIKVLENWCLFLHDKSMHFVS